MPSPEPLLPDPGGAAQRVALEIMALPPERRTEALEKSARVYAALAEVRGAPKAEAAAFALGMKRRIMGAIRAIEVSGGGAGGRG